MTDYHEIAESVKSLPAIQTIHTAEVMVSGERVVISNSDMRDLSYAITKLVCFDGGHVVAIY